MKVFNPKTWPVKRIALVKANCGAQWVQHDRNKSCNECPFACALLARRYREDSSSGDCCLAVLLNVASSRDRGHVGPFLKSFGLRGVGNSWRQVQRGFTVCPYFLALPPLLFGLSHLIIVA